MIDVSLKLELCTIIMKIFINKGIYILDKVPTIKLPKRTQESTKLEIK